MPALAKILAAVELELRIALAPYDDHDDILDADRLSPDEQAAQRADQDAFARRRARPALLKTKELGAPANPHDPGEGRRSGQDAARSRTR